MDDSNSAKVIERCCAEWRELVADCGREDEAWRWAIESVRLVTPSLRNIRSRLIDAYEIGYLSPPISLDTETVHKRADGVVEKIEYAPSSVRPLAILSLICGSSPRPTQSEIFRYNDLSLAVIDAEERAIRQAMKRRGWKNTKRTRRAWMSPADRIAKTRLKKSSKSRR